MSRDLTEHANFEIANVSTDKRSLRENKSFYLNEVDFEAPYILRFFTIHDTI